MIVSVLRRTTAIADHEEWERRKSRLLDRLQPLLERQPGFAGVQLDRGDGGSMSETTSWQSMEDCRRYLRGGGAATVATISDAFLPTAPYPNGAWLRETTEDPADS
jgi:heme-degrading monooxygenase HmoA